MKGFDIDLRGLVEARSAVDPAVLTKALRSATRKIGAQAKTVAVKTLTDRYYLKAKDIRDEIGVTVTSSDGLTATVTVRDRKPLKLALFQPKQFKGGTKFKIMRGSAREIYPISFPATMASGHKGFFSRYNFKGELNKPRFIKKGLVRDAFGRAFGTRLGRFTNPIREMVGPWLSGLFGGGKVVAAINELVKDKAEEIISHEIKYFQSKA